MRARHGVDDEGGETQTQNSFRCREQQDIKEEEEERPTRTARRRRRRKRRRRLCLRLNGDLDSKSFSSPLLSSSSSPSSSSHVALLPSFLRSLFNDSSRPASLNCPCLSLSLAQSPQTVHGARGVAVAGGGGGGGGDAHACLRRNVYCCLITDGHGHVCEWRPEEEKMRAKAIPPDAPLFLTLLTACKTFFSNSFHDASSSSSIIIIMIMIKMR